MNTKKRGQILQFGKRHDQVPDHKQVMPTQNVDILLTV